MMSPLRIYLAGAGVIARSHDQAGTLHTEPVTLQRNAINHFDRPLLSFYDRCRGNPSPSVLNEHALFNFSILDAIYTCAATDRPQSVASSPPLPQPP